MEQDPKFMRCSGTFTVSTGGGITAEQMIAVLQAIYRGEANVTDQVLESLKCYDGPAKFYSVDRFALRNDLDRVTIAEVLEQEQYGLACMTNEIAFRWFLTAPSFHKYRTRCAGKEWSNKRILVLTPELTQINGQDHAMVFASGPGARVLMIPIDRSKTLCHYATDYLLCTPLLHE
jgi:hypothetical protein